MGCGSGRGANGGPWIMSAEQGHAIPSYINSVNSWLFIAQEGFEIQDPYSDSLACHGMLFATGWGGTC